MPCSEKGISGRFGDNLDYRSSDKNPYSDMNNSLMKVYSPYMKFRRNWVINDQVRHLAAILDKAHVRIRVIV